VEQLALILARTGPVSLKLDLFWPTMTGMLELISSSERSIRSLRFTNTSSTPLTISYFQHLNLADLQEFEVVKLPWVQSRQLMDLALRSTRSSMTLKIQEDRLTLDLLRHDLLKQVVKFDIEARQ
jgi:hypothetical protein